MKDALEIGDDRRMTTDEYMFRLRLRICLHHTLWFYSPRGGNWENGRMLLPREFQLEIFGSPAASPRQRAQIR